MSARLVAEFDAPRRLVLAARATRQASAFRVVDAYTPFAVEGLADELDDPPKTRVPLALLLGGLGGAALGAALQWIGATAGTALPAGGRPPASWPDFAFAIFELAILGAALSGFVALLVGCGLPRLHHPLFDVPNFERATQDRFFLEIEAGEDATAPARAHLTALGALSVAEVGR